jgi:FHS family L-fucose permease-like MFS transporter
VTKLGNPDFAERRLNFAQAFNGLGSVIAPAIGGAYIFTGLEYSQTELAAMTPETLDVYRTMEARTVQMPYMVIAIVVLMVAFLIYKTKMPVVDDEGENGKIRISKSLFKHTHLIYGIIAQLFYVGAQVGIWSYFIDFMKDLAPQTSEKTAAYYLSMNLVLFMVGRFSGSFLMTWVKPNRLLAIYSLINLVLILIGTMGSGMMAIYSIMLVSFFMSIMFPTIFALSIKNLGEDTKIGSSLVIMAIIGGALFPLVMGYLAVNNIQTAFFVPFLCFIVVFVFAMWGYKVKELKVHNQ